MEIASATGIKSAWMCRICDLFPHTTKTLTKSERMNIAKVAGLELEKRRKGKA